MEKEGFVTNKIIIQTLFDIQYIFLQIRCQSVGEEIVLRFKHPEDKNEKGEECKHVQEVTNNLNDIKPEAREGHTKKIELSNEIGVVMRYPNVDMLNIFAQTVLYFACQIACVMHLGGCMVVWDENFCICMWFISIYKYSINL